MARSFGDADMEFHDASSIDNDALPAPDRHSIALLPSEFWSTAYLMANPQILDQATRTNPRRVGEVFAQASAPPVNSPPPPQQQQPRVTRARVPDPQAYDGTTGRLYAFLDALTNKITVDAHLFDTEDSKVGYAYACLAPKAQERLSVDFAHYRDPSATKSTSVSTFPEFVKLLKRRFDDPNRGQKADQQVVTMKQGSRTFSDFLVDWNNALTHSGYKSDPDGTKIRLLTAALSYNLRQNFVGREKPVDSYDSFVDFCKKVDADLQELASIRPHSVQPSRSSAPVRPSAVPLASTSIAEPPTTPLTVMQGGDLMDLDAKSREKTTDGKLTERAKDARRALNRCLRCNRPGHIARNCPLGQRVNLVEAGPSIVEITDESLKEPL